VERKNFILLKTLDTIPTHKIARAGKLVETGIKVGGNYLKYYGDKIIHGDSGTSKLDRNNAKDIYDGLKQLKGSALKVAQMLSMEKNLLPQAYVEQFSLSQFSVPPLSGPLVKKIIRKNFGRNPEDLFDTFVTESVNAASIGQVHKASKNGKKLAVKIQYPGVADSIGSDLALVKPFAYRMLNLKGNETEKYFREVEEKLMEETDYVNELKNSQSIAQACQHLPGMLFPNYYAEWSCEKVITMDWMEGQHLSEFVQSKDYDTEIGAQVGQHLWDFYMYQIHHLRKVQADPHPGNFLIDQEYRLVAIDFGCIKEVPEDFYHPYFELSKLENLNNPKKFKALLEQLEILLPNDSVAEIDFFTTLFLDMMRLFTQPFHTADFDFSDPEFWEAITNLSKTFAENPALKKLNGSRGSKHFIYINRTFFGLYHLLHDLGAKVKIDNYLNFV